MERTCEAALDLPGHGRDIQAGLRALLQLLSGDGQQRARGCAHPRHRPDRRIACQELVRLHKGRPN